MVSAYFAAWRTNGDIFIPQVHLMYPLCMSLMPCGQPFSFNFETSVGLMQLNCTLVPSHACPQAAFINEFNQHGIHAISMQQSSLCSETRIQGQFWSCKHLHPASGPNNVVLSTDIPSISSLPNYGHGQLSSQP